MVQYKVHWRVNRGTMGGFYFQGEQGKIDWHRPGCGAVVNGQRRFDLDLRDLGNRWDVLLSRGQRFGPGEITYVLTYFTDYAAVGHLATTTSPEFGELVVFNWAPVQWDEALEHETVLVRWPIRVEKAEMSLEEVSELGLRTDPLVNEHYKLSYLGRRGTAVSAPEEPQAGDRYLVVRAHEEDVAPQEKMQLTYFVPTGVFRRRSCGRKLDGLSLRRRSNHRMRRALAARWPQDGIAPTSVGRLVALLFVGGLIVVGFFIVRLKHGSLIARPISSTNSNGNETTGWYRRLN